MAYRQLSNVIFNTNTGLTINEDELDQLDTRIGVIEAIVPSQVVLRDGTNNMTGNLDLNSNKIENLGDATTATDAMNQQSSDARYVELAGDTMTGNLAMGTNLITGLGDATTGTDAMNQQSSDARYVELAGDTMTGNLAMGSNLITGLGDAVSDTDGLNRQTADGRYIYKDQNDTSTGSLHFDGVLNGSGGTVADTMKLRIGDRFGFLPFVTGATYEINNGYLNSGWKRISTGYSSLIIHESDGSIQFYNGGYGVAGSAISFSPRFAVENTQIDCKVLLNMNNTKIINLAAGSSSADALRYDQLVGVYLPLAGGTMSGSINMGSNNITEVSTITNSTSDLNITTTGAYNLTVQSAQGLNLISTDNASTAINIHASNNAGVVTIQSFSNQAITVTDTEVNYNVPILMASYIDCNSNNITGAGSITEVGSITNSTQNLTISTTLANDLTIQSAQALNLISTDNSVSALNINASNSGGLVTIQTNTNNAITVSNATVNLSVPMTMGSNKITGLAAGTTNGDAVRYEQLVGAYLPLSGGTVTGVLTVEGSGSGFILSSASDFYSTTRNNGTGGCYHQIYAGTADPYLKISTSTTDFTIGIDNNDSDKLKITNSATPSSGATAITIDTNENTTLGGSLTMSNNSILGVNDINLNTDTFIKFFDGLGTNTCGIYWSDINHAFFCHRSSNIMYYKEYGTHVWQTLGTNTRMQLSSSGLIVGAPTGSFKGGGTINASAIYDDGTLLTCFPFLKYFDGDVDVEAYNSKFPDITYEEGYWDPEDEEEHKPEKQKFRTVTKKKEHEGICKFLAKCDSEYNPLDVDCYWKHIEDKKHLPAMPNPDKWNDDNQASTGGYIARLIETVECQAIHIHQLNERLKILESKLNI